MSPHVRLRESVRITKRSIEALEASESDYFVWDNQLIGFGARVYSTGKKVFVLKYRVRGDLRTRRERLGVFPQLTADEARKRATILLGRVANGEALAGEDASTRKLRTCGSLFPVFLEERAPKLKPRTVAEYDRLWKASLSATFGATRIGTLTEEQVSDWHVSRSATPMLANRGVDLLAALCSWAERKRYRERGSNPCARDLVERYREVTRKKSLRVEDYGRLGATLATALETGLPPAPEMRSKKRGVSAKRRAKLTGRKRSPYERVAEIKLTPANPVTIAVLRFLALSGWRENEALTLQWDMVDATRSVAILPDTKTNRSVRPLGRAAVAVLLSQTRLTGNPYVFPGLKPGAHLRETKHTWTNVKHSAELTMRLHDLRHSFATVARGLGYGDHVIAALIGHTLDGMTSKYGDVPDSLVQAAAHRIAETIVKHLDRGSA